MSKLPSKLYARRASLVLSSLVLCLAAALPAGATVLSIAPIGEFDGNPNLDTTSTYPQPSVTIGTFTYTIPTGESIVSATVSGFFGTSYAPTTAPEDLYVAGVLVASCVNPTDACIADPTGVQTPWSYTFTSSQFSALAGGSADYTVIQNGAYQVESGITTLDITTASAPEPATIAMCCGGFSLLFLARRRRRA